MKLDRPIRIDAISQLTSFKPLNLFGGQSLKKKSLDQDFYIFLDKLQQGLVPAQDIEVIRTVIVDGKPVHIYSGRVTRGKRAVFFIKRFGNQQHFVLINYAAQHDKAYDNHDGRLDQSYLKKQIRDFDRYLQTAFQEAPVGMVQNLALLETPSEKSNITSLVQLDHHDLIHESLQQILTLTPEQYEALKSDYHQQILILEAPAGCGKTTTALCLITQVLTEEGERVQKGSPLKITFACTGHEVVNATREKYEHQAISRETAADVKFIHLSSSSRTQYTRSQILSLIQTTLQHTALLTKQTVSPEISCERLYTHCINLYTLYQHHVMDDQYTFEQILQKYREESSISISETEGIALKTVFSKFIDIASDNGCEGIHYDDLITEDQDLIVIDEGHNLPTHMLEKIRKKTARLVVLAHPYQAYLWGGISHLSIWKSLLYRQNISFQVKKLQLQHRSGFQIHCLARRIEELIRQGEHGKSEHINVISDSQNPGDVRYFKNLDHLLSQEIAKTLFQESNSQIAVVTTPSRRAELSQKYPQLYVLSDDVVPGADYQLVILDGFDHEAFQDWTPADWEWIEKGHATESVKAMSEFRRIMMVITRGIQASWICLRPDHLTHEKSEYTREEKALLKLLQAVTHTPVENPLLFEIKPTTQEEWHWQVIEWIRKGKIEFAKEIYHKHLQVSQSHSFEESFAEELTCLSQNIRSSSRQLTFSVQTKSPELKSPETLSLQKNHKKSQATKNKTSPKNYQSVQKWTALLNASKGSDLQPLKKISQKELHELIFSPPGDNQKSLFAKKSDLSLTPKERGKILSQLKNILQYRPLHALLNADFFLLEIEYHDQKLTTLTFLIQETGSDPVSQELVMKMLECAVLSSISEKKKLVENTETRRALMTSPFLKYFPAECFDDFDLDFNAMKDDQQIFQMQLSRVKEEKLFQQMWEFLALKMQSQSYQDCATFYQQIKKCQSPNQQNYLIELRKYIASLVTQMWRDGLIDFLRDESMWGLLSQLEINFSQIQPPDTPDSLLFYVLRQNDQDYEFFIHRYFINASLKDYQYRYTEKGSSLLIESAKHASSHCFLNIFEYFQTELAQKSSEFIDMINHKTPDGFTVLHALCHQDLCHAQLQTIFKATSSLSLKIIQEQFYVQIHSQEYANLMPIEYAVLQDNCTALESFLEYYYKQISIFSEKTVDLHWNIVIPHLLPLAITAQAINCCEFLIQHEIDLHLEDDYKRNILQQLTDDSSIPTELVRLYLEKISSQESLIHQIRKDDVSVSGMASAVENVIIYDRLDLLKLLHQYDFDFFEKEYAEGRNVLLLSLKYHANSVFEWLYAQFLEKNLPIESVDHHQKSTIDYLLQYKPAYISLLKPRLSHLDSLWIHQGVQALIEAVELEDSSEVVRIMRAYAANIQLQEVFEKEIQENWEISQKLIMQLGEFTADIHLLLFQMIPLDDIPPDCIQKIFLNIAEQNYLELSVTSLRKLKEYDQKYPQNRSIFRGRIRETLGQDQDTMSLLIYAISLGHYRAAEAICHFNLELGLDMLRDLESMSTLLKVAYVSPYSLWILLLPHIPLTQQTVEWSENSIWHTLYDSLEDSLLKVNAFYEYSLSKDIPPPPQVMNLAFEYQDEALLASTIQRMQKGLDSHVMQKVLTRWIEQSLESENVGIQQVLCVHWDCSLLPLDQLKSWLIVATQIGSVAMVRHICRYFALSAEENKELPLWAQPEHCEWWQDLLLTALAENQFDVFYDLYYQHLFDIIFESQEMLIRFLMTYLCSVRVEYTCLDQQVAHVLEKIRLHLKNLAWKIPESVFIQALKESHVSFVEMFFPCIQMEWQITKTPRESLLYLLLKLKKYQLAFDILNHQDIDPTYVQRHLFAQSTLVSFALSYPDHPLIPERALLRRDLVQYLTNEVNFSFSQNVFQHQALFQAIQHDYREEVLMILRAYQKQNISLTEYSYPLLQLILKCRPQNRVEYIQQLQECQFSWIIESSEAKDLGYEIIQTKDLKLFEIFLEDARKNYPFLMNLALKTDESQPKSVLELLIEDRQDEMASALLTLVYPPQEFWDENTYLLSLAVNQDLPQTVRHILQHLSLNFELSLTNHQSIREQMDDYLNHVVAQYQADLLLLAFFRKNIEMFTIILRYYPHNPLHESQILHRLVAEHKMFFSLKCHEAMISMKDHSSFVQKIFQEYSLEEQYIEHIMRFKDPSEVAQLFQRALWAEHLKAKNHDLSQIIKRIWNIFPIVTRYYSDYLLKVALDYLTEYCSRENLIKELLKEFDIALSQEIFGTYSRSLYFPSLRMFLNFVNKDIALLKTPDGDLVIDWMLKTQRITEAFVLARSCSDLYYGQHAQMPLFRISAEMIERILSQVSWARDKRSLVNRLIKQLFLPWNIYGSCHLSDFEIPIDSSVKMKLSTLIFSCVQRMEPQMLDHFLRTTVKNYKKHPEEMKKIFSDPKKIAKMKGKDLVCDRVMTSILFSHHEMSFQNSQHLEYLLFQMLLVRNDSKKLEGLVMNILKSLFPEKMAESTSLNTQEGFSREMRLTVSMLRNDFFNYIPETPVGEEQSIENMQLHNYIIITQVRILLDWILKDFSSLVREFVPDQYQKLDLALSRARYHEQVYHRNLSQIGERSSISNLLQSNVILSLRTAYSKFTGIDDYLQNEWFVYSVRMLLMIHYQWPVEWHCVAYSLIGIDPLEQPVFIYWKWIYWILNFQLITMMDRDTKNFSQYIGTVNYLESQWMKNTLAKEGRIVVTEAELEQMKESEPFEKKGMTESEVQEFFEFPVLFSGNTMAVDWNKKRGRMKNS